MKTAERKRALRGTDKSARGWETEREIETVILKPKAQCLAEKTPNILATREPRGRFCISARSVISSASADDDDDGDMYVQFLVRLVAHGVIKRDVFNYLFVLKCIQGIADDVLCVWVGAEVG